MALKQKLDTGDIALLEVIEDPIWLGELLRSTADGEINKELHPTDKWKYRDYQRQFLSDKTEFILYTGGRAIGKCQLGSSRVLTDTGYRRIRDLVEESTFIVYTLTPEMQLEQRRAIATFDRNSPVYTVVTESGYRIAATMNHPFLTPDGYRLLEFIKPNDRIAVTTKLPYESTRSALMWHELRILGYIYLQPWYKVTKEIKPRYAKIGAELEVIADRLVASWVKDKYTGAYKIKARSKAFKHPIQTLMDELKVYRIASKYGANFLPPVLLTERLENIQVFLEALFAQFGELSTTKFSIKLGRKLLAEQMREVLLRFGIETRITEETWSIESLDYRAAYRFWNTFTLPGVSVGELKPPPATEDATEFMRFDRVVDIYQSHKNSETYALYVYDTNNYISDYAFVHNSVILEDKIIYDVINNDLQFPNTKESVLVTANQAQMTPLLNKLVIRFTSGKILKDFLRNQVNKSDGTMRFPNTGKPLIFNFRIAGSRGESNMVGLHVPRITGDEMQLFPLNAFTQLQPAYNQWEKNRQQVMAGVPNGLQNTVLYQLDIKTPKYKKYRIPSHMNPYYTYEDDQDNIRRYGGEQDDRYVQLVLGRHGQAAFQVIPRETIKTETYPFYSYRYNSQHSNKGKQFKDVLERPSLPKDTQHVILAIDPGFVDATIIQVLARDPKGVWRTYVRYRLTRIDFNEQQDIIDWIATFYNAVKISIDIGAGGNGSSIMHNLMYGDSYKGKKYESRLFGVQFSENLISGYDDVGEELKQDSKSYATTELAKTIQDGRLVFSELDHEGISQLERVAKIKSTAGKDRYFILSDKGSGADNDDHIFASYICFILAIRSEILNPTTRKLGKPRGFYKTHE